jgi:hypothetical protein
MIQTGTFTALEDIQIDVRLKDGVTTMPLMTLIDLIYPLIEKRMNDRLAIQLRTVSVSANVPLNREKLVDAISTTWIHSKK